jgi:tetratricopeptide (TPR) repeat protein
VRDALAGARPTTDRSGSPVRSSDEVQRDRTTYGRPGLSDRTTDSLIDLRPASSPQPTRVRFPRSYNTGERERLATANREERAAALDRDRLYAARIAGRDAAARSTSENEARERTTRSAADRSRTDRTGTSSLDRDSRRSSIDRNSRTNDASPDRPRLSDRRVEQARIARESRVERVSDARLTARQKSRQNEIAKDARDAYRAKAKVDSAFGSRVRAEAQAAQFTTELALNTGLSVGLGITLGVGWSSDFGGYTTVGYWDDCYRPTWCSYPSYYGYPSQWAWNACWWWYRPYYPYYASSYCYAGWWYPWSYGYWGSTVYRTEVVYVETETIPAAEVADQAAPAGNAERAPGADSDALRRSAGRYLQLGDDAFQLGQYGRAVHYYAKAIELSPDDGVLYLVLSDALFATGDYHYAAYALRRAFELEPDLALMQFDKRDLYSDPAAFDEQLGQLELYLDDHFLDEDARLLLAANYLFGGAPERALEFLDDPFSVEVAESEIGAVLRDAAVAAVERKR